MIRLSRARRCLDCCDPRAAPSRPTLISRTRPGAAAASDGAAGAVPRGAHTAGTPPHEGRDAIREFMQRRLGATERVAFTADQIFVAGDSATVKWTADTRRRVSRFSTANTRAAGPLAELALPRGLLAKRVAMMAATYAGTMR